MDEIMKSKLEILIKQIKNKQISIVYKKNDIKNIKEIIEAESLNLKVIIQSELDEKNKKKFSNEDSRRLEFIQRSIKDISLCKKNHRTFEMETNCRAMEIDLEYDKNELRMYEILSRLGVI